MQRPSYVHQMLACAPDPSLSSAVSACSIHPPGALMARRNHILINRGRNEMSAANNIPRMWRPILPRNCLYPGRPSGTVSWNSRALSLAVDWQQFNVLCN
jgi:hypothetical protein